MKRILAFVLCVVLLLSASSVSATAVDTDSITDTLLTFSAEDRLNLMTIAVSMTAQNSGVELATELILEYDPDSDRLFDKYMKRVFAIVSQERVLHALSQMYKMDEGLRYKYFYGLLDRVELPLSASGTQILQGFFEEEILRRDALAQVCAEDGITVPVIAHFSRFFVELNGFAPLLSDANETDFAVGTVNYVLDDVALGLSENKISFTQGLTELCAKLNQRYDAAEKLSLKKALREIGWYVPSLQYAGTGAIGGNVTVEPQMTMQDGFGYRIVSRNAAEGDTIEVAYFENGKAVEGKTLSAPLKLAIPVNAANVMLCDADGRAVKYTAYADGMLYCRVDKLGMYTLYATEPYFTDANGWGKDYIEALFRRGIISGKSAGVFAPEAQITREEFVKLAVELFELTDKNLTCDFADVAADAWYAPYIASAKHHGIVNGISETTFGVGAPITRQDMCKILYGMLVKMELAAGVDADTLPFGDAAQIAPYATEAVGTLVSLGIIKGDDVGNFNPQNNATRQEAAKLIYGMLSLYVR